LDNFDEEENKPLILPCGHTVCKKCLKGIFKVGTITCPFCKKVFKIANVYDCPPNFTILSSIERKQPIEEKKVNVQGVLGQIKSLALSIKQAVSHEKIEIFTNISFDQIESKNFDNEKLDELLCQLLTECHKLTGYTKEGLQHFVQAFLEQRSVISRMFMIKKKLEEVRGVLDIVSKSIQYADEQIWKYHEQAKAKLSLDYIRNNYLSAESINANAKANSSGSGQAKDTSSTLSAQARKFMDKLNNIKDEVSREKVRKEK